jgi:hypothetical protein
LEITAFHIKAKDKKSRVSGLDLGEDLTENDGPDESDHAERPRTITPTGDLGAFSSKAQDISTQFLANPKKHFLAKPKQNV